MSDLIFNTLFIQYLETYLNKCHQKRKLKLKPPKQLNWSRSHLQSLNRHSRNLLPNLRSHQRKITKKLKILNQSQKKKNRRQYLHHLKKLEREQDNLALHLHHHQIHLLKEVEAENLFLLNHNQKQNYLNRKQIRKLMTKIQKNRMRTKKINKKLWKL